MIELSTKNVLATVCCAILLTGFAFGQTNRFAADNNQVVARNTDSKKTAARHKKIARRYFEQIWNQGNLDLLDEFLTEDYTVEKPLTGAEEFNVANKKSLISEFKKAFPDAQVRIKELKTLDDDSVLVRLEITGTHRAAFQGIEPTNKRIKVDQMQLKRFDNGKIRFHTQILDDQQLVAQLVSIR